MIEPDHDDFNHGGQAFACYKTVADVELRTRQELKARMFAAGAVVEVAGLPHTALLPLNSEAAYAKFSAVRRAVRLGYVDNLSLLAESLGAAPSLPGHDPTRAWAWIKAWLQNPVPLTDKDRTP